jgi:carbonic anhydrase/acetyltransferase-like protein (isoleucine patch superfamily)
MPIREFENHLPSIAATVYIDPMALVIGEVTIGEYAFLWPMVVARGDIYCITIGARTNVQDNTVLHVTHDGRFCPGGYALTIGEDVTIGYRAILYGCSIERHCCVVWVLLCLMGRFYNLIFC